jgi:hypothetical protein
LILLLLVTATPSSEPVSQLPARPFDLREALERETASLQAELDLASGPDFYLRLDRRRGRLALMLQGVVLEERPLDLLETAVPQVLFWNRPPPSDWDLRSYGGGTLEPERQRDRVEIVAPAPSPPGDAAALEPTPPPLPPTVEESYSVPSRYRIRFADGPTLEVTARDGGRNRGLVRRAVDGVALWREDLVSPFRARGAERVRLRLRMSAEDAAALYRSLPPDVTLLVVGLAPR